VRLTAGQGRPRAALAAARPLLSHPAVNERARTTLALGAVEALFASGKFDEAVAIAEDHLPLAGRLRDQLPHAEAVLLGMRAFTLRLAGRLVEATAFSERAYARLLESRSATGTAVEANSLGLIWLARGRVQTALRFCRESAAILRDGDSVGMLAFALAGIADAAAQAGDAETATAAVAEMDRTPLAHQGFAAELGLARAWAAAARGELSGARTHARKAAELARAREQHAFAARALHELCRLGDPEAAAPELARLAGGTAGETRAVAAGTRAVAAEAHVVDGPFVIAAAAHAAALVAGDGAAVLAAAEQYAANDALLVAAEAADAAAAMFQDSGREASARAAAARAAVWLEACEGARPPTLLGAPEAAELTPREREIALLAAGGASSREIAGRLVLSVRTVDNHLQSAYRKLGVSRRQDLREVLT
jgi:ATP/maltotriose-dependent transcriptional regulator MalT